MKAEISYKCDGAQILLFVGHTKYKWECVVDAEIPC